MAKLHFRSYTTNQIFFFPQRIDENIAENDPVRIVSSIVDHLDMSSVNKLYNGMGRCPYHPRMMLKVIIYAYMNNIYSCRRIEQLLLRDIHFDCIAQDNTKTDETVEFTPSQLAEISAELNASLSDPQVEMDKEEKKKRRKLAKELKERSEKLAE